MVTPESPQPVGVGYVGDSTCWGCGRRVKHRANGGPRRRHGCRARLLSRLRWRGHLDGWHAGYRFAVDNFHDDMVQADLDDYGRGWAGYMRTGDPVRIVIDEQQGEK